MQTYENYNAKFIRWPTKNHKLQPASQSHIELVFTRRIVKLCTFGDVKQEFVANAGNSHVFSVYA